MPRYETFKRGDREMPTRKTVDGLDGIRLESVLVPREEEWQELAPSVAQTTET